MNELEKLMANLQRAKVHLQAVKAEAERAGLGSNLEEVIKIIVAMEGTLSDEWDIPFQRVAGLCVYEPMQQR